MKKENYNEIKKAVERATIDLLSFSDSCISVVSESKLLYVYFDDENVDSEEQARQVTINISESSNNFKDDKKILEYLLDIKATGGGTLIIVSLT